MLCFLICHFFSGLLTNEAAATQISFDPPLPCLAFPCHSTIETFQSAARRTSRMSALVTTVPDYFRDLARASLPFWRSDFRERPHPRCFLGRRHVLQAAAGGPAPMTADVSPVGLPGSYRRGGCPLSIVGAWFAVRGLLTDPQDPSREDSSSLCTDQPLHCPLPVLRTAQAGSMKSSRPRGS